MQQCSSLKSTTQPEMLRAFIYLVAGIILWMRPAIERRTLHCNVVSHWLAAYTKRSQSCKISCHIPWNLEAVRYGFEVVWLLWNMTGGSGRVPTLSGGLNSRLFPDFFQTISVIFKTGFYHILYTICYHVKGTKRRVRQSSYLIKTVL